MNGVDRTYEVGQFFGIILSCIYEYIAQNPYFYWTISLVFPSYFSHIAKTQKGNNFSRTA